jgi:cysteine desulfurase
VTLPRGDGRALLMAAQLQGLAISSGSACSSGAARPSAALLALGLDEASARRSLRLSLGPATTSVDIAHAVSILRALHARFAALDVS